MQTTCEGCLNLVPAVKLLAEDAQQSESNPRKLLSRRSSCRWAFSRYQCRWIQLHGCRAHGIAREVMWICNVLPWTTQAHKVDRSVSVRAGVKAFNSSV